MAEIKQGNGHLDGPEVRKGLKHQDLVVVKLSDEERRTGQLTAENMGLAVLGFIRDGIAILENAVDPQHCDAINKVMVDELPELIKDPKTHWNDVGCPLPPESIRDDAVVVARYSRPTPLLLSAGLRTRTWQMCAQRKGLHNQAERWLIC